MELNYKLITKEQLPTEARIAFAIDNADFYCWLYKEQLLINAEAPYLDLVLDALQVYWKYEIIDEESDAEMDHADKIISKWWSSAGSRQVNNAWFKRSGQEQTKRHEAWAMAVLNRYGGAKGIEILDAMENDESHLYNTLYNMAVKLNGHKNGWHDFINCAYLYAYNKGMEAAQRAAG